MTNHTLNVRVEGVEVAEGLFELKRFLPDMDYIDAVKQRWIWSIGKNVHNGRIFAATDTRFYQDPNWECLYLK